MFLKTSQASLPDDQGLSAYRVLAGEQHVRISIVPSSEGTITNTHRLISYWLTVTGWMQPAAASQFLPHLLKGAHLVASNWWMKIWWVSCRASHKHGKVKMLSLLCAFLGWEHVYSSLQFWGFRSLSATCQVTWQLLRKCFEDKLGLKSVSRAALCLHPLDIYLELWLQIFVCLLQTRYFILTQTFIISKFNASLTRMLIYFLYAVSYSEIAFSSLSLGGLGCFVVCLFVFF